MNSNHAPFPTAEFGGLLAKRLKALGETLDSFDTKVLYGDRSKRRQTTRLDFFAVQTRVNSTLSRKSTSALS